MAGSHSRVKSFFLRLVLALVIVPVVAYLGLGTLLWWAMHRSPEQFGRVMAKMPMPYVFIIYPFESMWLHARAGNLNVGDSAPDFSLMKVDKSGSIRLSELNKQQPVVLVFGSYT